VHQRAASARRGRSSLGRRPQESCRFRLASRRTAPANAMGMDARTSRPHRLIRFVRALSQPASPDHSVRKGKEPQSTTFTPGSTTYSAGVARTGTKARMTAATKSVAATRNETVATRLIGLASAAVWRAQHPGPHEKYRRRPTGTPCQTPRAVTPCTGDTARIAAAHEPYEAAPIDRPEPSIA
jgi:hypothetical protein